MSTILKFETGFFCLFIESISLVKRSGEEEEKIRERNPILQTAFQRVDANLD